MFSVIVISAVEVHPLLNVPVTVYVAPVVKSRVASVEAPSDQVYESAPLAVTLISVFTQVSSVEELASLLVTEVTEVDAQSIRNVCTGSEY